MTTIPQSLAAAPAPHGAAGLSVASATAVSSRDMRGIVTTIDDDVEFRGTLTVTTNKGVLIRGTFDGEIKSEGAVIVAESGRINGSVKSRKLIVAGRVDCGEGSVEVLGLLLMLRGGSLVAKTISYGDLEHERGARLVGALNPFETALEDDAVEELVERRVTTATATSAPVSRVAPALGQALGPVAQQLPAAAPYQAPNPAPTASSPAPVIPRIAPTAAPTVVASPPTGLALAQATASARAQMAPIVAAALSASPAPTLPAAVPPSVRAANLLPALPVPGSTQPVPSYAAIAPSRPLAPSAAPSAPTASPAHTSHPSALRSPPPDIAGVLTALELGGAFAGGAEGSVDLDFRDPTDRMGLDGLGDLNDLSDMPRPGEFVPLHSLPPQPLMRLPEGAFNGDIVDHHAIGHLGNNSKF